MGIGRQEKYKIASLERSLAESELSKKGILADLQKLTSDFCCQQNRLNAERVEGSRIRERLLTRDRALARARSEKRDVEKKLAASARKLAWSKDSAEGLKESLRQAKESLEEAENCNKDLSTELISLKTGHATEKESLTGVHKAELEVLEAGHRAALEALQVKHATEVKRLQGEAQSFWSSKFKSLSGQLEGRSSLPASLSAPARVRPSVTSTRGVPAAPLPVVLPTIVEEAPRDVVVAAIPSAYVDPVEAAKEGVIPTVATEELREVTLPSVPALATTTSSATVIDVDDEDDNLTISQVIKPRSSASPRVEKLLKVKQEKVDSRERRD